MCLVMLSKTSGCNLQLSQLLILWLRDAKNPEIMFPSLSLPRGICALLRYPVIFSEPIIFSICKSLNPPIRDRQSETCFSFIFNSAG